MANTGNRVPATTTRGGVAGLFKDEDKAERAIDELKTSGFSDSEIGIAAAHQEGKIGRFWDNVTSRFGKHERTEHANDLHDSLRDAGVPEQQAEYFNSVLADGGVLIIVHTHSARASQA